MSLHRAQGEYSGDVRRNIRHLKSEWQPRKLIDRLPRIGKSLGGITAGFAGLLFAAQTAFAAPITFTFDVSAPSDSDVAISGAVTSAPFSDPTVALTPSIAPFNLDLAGTTMATFESFIFTPDVVLSPGPNTRTATGNIDLKLDVSLSDGGSPIGMTTTTSMTGEYTVNYSNVGGINTGSVSATVPTPVMVTIGSVAFEIEIVTKDSQSDPSFPSLGPGLPASFYDIPIEAKVTLLNLAELSVDPSPLDFGDVRIGTTSTEMLTVENTGDPGSLLMGTFGGASAPFAPAGTEGFSLGGGGTADRDYDFTPTTHSSETTDVTVSSNAGDEIVSLKGEGVGPEFSAATSVDFGLVEVGDMSQVDLDISNISTDIADLALVGLTLIDLEIIGVDALFFEILNEIDLVGEVIDVGEMLTAMLKFMPTEMTPRLYEAELKITTDQNAAFTESGDMFFIDLSGLSFKDDPPVVVSEPLPIAIFVVGLVTLALARRRQDKCRKA